MRGGGGRTVKPLLPFSEDWGGWEWSWDFWVF
jgi:hypothetical protein